MVWVGEKSNSDSDVYKEDSSDEDEMWRPGLSGVSPFISSNSCYSRPVIE